MKKPEHSSTDLPDDKQKLKKMVRERDERINDLFKEIQSLKQELKLVTEQTVNEEYINVNETQQSEISNTSVSQGLNEEVNVEKGK